MIKLLKCEYKKTRRLYIFLTAVIITAAEIFWALHGEYNEFSITNGWMMFLYQFPLINSIFMPVLSIIIASRICDNEHKGVMLKQLFVIAEKGKIYDAKFIYGISIVIFCNIISWCAAIAFGYFKGFSGDVPLNLYILHLLFSVVPTVAIYIFQHVLSLLFKNQAVTFFAGIIGTFGGLFAMFLPQFPAFRRILIWGYYGALQFVGMYGWTSETRYANVYFAVENIDWLFFGVLIAMCAAMYLIGRMLFCRKEV